MRAQALVGGARRRGLHDLLGLPAPGQPLARRAGARTSCSREVRGRPTATPAPLRALRAPSRPRRSRARAGATAATSAAPGCSCSTRAPGRVLDARPPRDARRRGVGVGRRAGRRATSTTCSSPLAARAARRPACTTSRRGTRRSATAPGASRAARVGREAAPGPRPRALGGVRRLVRAAGRAACARSPRPARAGAGLDRACSPGDVHHAYLAEAAFPRDAGVTQPVCRPSARRSATRWTRASAARCGRRCRGPPRWSRGRWRAPPASRDPPLRWRFVEAPTFDNQVATLLVEGREARLLVEKTRPEDWADPRLHVTLDRVIAGPRDGRVAGLR